MRFGTQLQNILESELRLAIIVITRHWRQAECSEFSSEPLAYSPELLLASLPRRKMEVKLDKEMTTALTKLNRSHGHGTRSATQNNGNGDEKHKDQNADDNLKNLSKESEEDLTDQILQNKMTKLLMQKPQK